MWAVDFGECTELVATTFFFKNEDHGYSATKKSSTSNDSTFTRGAFKPDTHKHQQVCVYHARVCTCVSVYTTNMAGRGENGMLQIEALCLRG